MSEPNLNGIFSGGGLSALLQNPEVAAKLPRIMEALAPIMEEVKAEKSTVQNDSTENEHAAEEMALPKAKQTSEASERRRALLGALEPYLSDSRRGAMEHINKVLLLIDMLSEVI